MAFLLQSALAAEAEALVRHVRRSVALVAGRDGHGAGVVWDAAHGLIVTNHHVVPRSEAQVETEDGRTRRAIVLSRDPANDLALLQVSPTERAGLFAASLGDSRRLRVGELVAAVGHPRGVRGAAALGIVSASGSETWLSGKNAEKNDGKGGRELLQADVVLAPGNSGGPLADMEGRVVGIASMILSPGIALAVPSHIACAFVEQCRRRAWKLAA